MLDEACRPAFRGFLQIQRRVAAHPCVNALDVSVYGCHPLLERDGADRAGRVLADAGQGRPAGQVFGPAGARHDLCRLKHVAATPVVTEALPEREHLLLGRFGERAYVRETQHPRLVVREDGSDGRLLEHDLADPDLIRVGGPAPGEVALFSVVPVEQAPYAGIHSSNSMPSARSATTGSSIAVSALPMTR